MGVFDDAFYRVVALLEHRFKRRLAKGTVRLYPLFSPVTKYGDETKNQHAHRHVMVPTPPLPPQTRPGLSRPLPRENTVLPPPVWLPEPSSRAPYQDLRWRGKTCTDRPFVLGKKLPLVAG